MSQYILENDREAERLEKMSRIRAYQPQFELVPVPFYPGNRVLDAGCGSGLVARYLADHYPGLVVEACDLSAVRIEQARAIRMAEKGREDIRFFVSPLESISAADATYDRITCRYVFEFLPDPRKVLGEFLRVLKPGGIALVIQFDGFLYNIAHRNPELGEMLRCLQQNAPFDMFLGRKLPAMMLESGFEKVDWDVLAYGFKGEDLVLEQEQMRERIGFSLPILAQVLGSQEKATRFRDLYCQEMVIPGNLLFYNKFLVSGQKPSRRTD